MALELNGDIAVFSDTVPVDEAERLHEWVLSRIQEGGAAATDLGACTHLHPANLQVLMAAGARVVTWPADADLRAWLESALTPR